MVETSDAGVSIIPSQLINLLKKTIPTGHPVLITGAPGIGKTEISKQVSEQLKVKIHITHPVVDSPIDYKGAIYAANGVADFLPYGNLRMMIEAKEKLVVLLDDLGQAPPAVQAACMQLLLERSINGKKISDHVVFVACTNRKQDKAGVTGILEPVKSRFVTIVELVPSLIDWVNWALQTGLPPELISFVRMNPHYLTGFKPTADISNSPCPRTIHNVGKLIALDLPADLEFPAYAGAAGQAFAVKLMAHLKMARKLPDPMAIIMQPKTAYLPNASEPDIAHTICVALASYASPKTIGSIYQYAERLPADFAALLMNDCTTKSPAIQQETAYIKWVSKNHGSIVGLAA